MSPRLLITVSFLLASLLHAVTPLEITLVSEVKSIRAGQPFYVGLSLHHGAGYHTYWKYPGIVGVPTNIQWLSLPEGFHAEPIDWPEPERTHMFQIKAQGYERDLVLPVKVTPPANLKPGSKVKLAGKASWMCCNRECNPGFKDLEIELPVSEGSAPDYDLSWKPKFEKELALRPLPSYAWSVTATSKDKTVVVTCKPGANAATISAEEAAKLIFFTEDGMIDSDKPQKIERLDDGTLRFTMIEPDYIVGDRPKEIIGLLVRAGGWEKGGAVRCWRFTAPLTQASVAAP